MHRTQFKKRSFVLLAATATALAACLGIPPKPDGASKAMAEQPAQKPQAKLTEKHQFFLEDHCYNCHDNSLQKGMVNLEALPLQITTLEQAELTQRAIHIRVLFNDRLVLRSIQTQEATP